MEVVIVAPSEDGLNLNNSKLIDSLRIKVVEVNNIKSIAQGNAAGIRQATAPIVVLAEDHSYPDPTWAEALIRTHQKPYASVGPVVRNANPDSVISWADFLIGYGPWLDPAPPGLATHLPGHNSSYKRELLLEYEDKLESMLEAEIVLHWDLRARGYQIYLEPLAKTSHNNFSLLSTWIRVQFLAGRVFASVRSTKWALIKRLIFVFGAPLIPAIRFWRAVSEMHKPGRLKNLGFSTRLGILTALALGLILDGLGQFAGYAFGAGDAKDKLSNFECHRYRHVKPNIVD